MSKKSILLLWIFTILAFVSVIGAAWAVWVFIHTPLLIHDTMWVGGQELTDGQREALYAAVLNAYRPMVLGGAGLAVAWVIFGSIALRGKPSN